MESDSHQKRSLFLIILPVCVYFATILLLSISFSIKFLRYVRNRIGKIFVLSSITLRKISNKSTQNVNTGNTAKKIKIWLCIIKQIKLKYKKHCDIHKDKCFFFVLAKISNKFVENLTHDKNLCSVISLLWKEIKSESDCHEALRFFKRLKVTFYLRNYFFNECHFTSNKED